MFSISSTREIVSPRDLVQFTIFRVVPAQTDHPQVVHLQNQIAFGQAHDQDLHVLVTLLRFIRREIIANINRMQTLATNHEKTQPRMQVFSMKKVKDADLLNPNTVQNVQESVANIIHGLKSESDNQVRSIQVDHLDLLNNRIKVRIDWMLATVIDERI